MTSDAPLRPTERAYLVLVSAFALWVVLWTWPWPAESGRALPWTLPPLHARVVGSLYAAGALALLASWRSRRRGTLHGALLLAVVWTGVLLLVSLLNVAQLADARPQLAFWWFAYAVFPTWGAWLWWLAPRPPRRAHASRPGLAAAAALALLGLALLARVPAVLAHWPWPLPPLLAQVYAGPVLACAVLIASLSCQAPHRDQAPVRAALALLAALLLLASALHADRLDAAAPGTWLWLAAPALGLLALGRAHALRSPDTARPGHPTRHTGPRP